MLNMSGHLGLVCSASVPAQRDGQKEQEEGTGSRARSPVLAKKQDLVVVRRMLISGSRRF